VKVLPRAAGMGVINRVVTTSDRNVAQRQGVVITRAKDSSEITVRGAWYSRRGEGTFYVPVREPTAFFGAALAEELRLAGVTINGAVRPARSRPPQMLPADRRVQIIHRSKLVDAVSVCNKNSQNFYAEMLFKRAGAKCFGTGTFDAGAKAATIFLAQAGVAPGTFSVSDGSGLSRENRFTPAQFAAVLGWIYRSNFGEDFVDSLAVSGVDRTLRKRLTDRYRGTIAAKTGTLTGVAALSGYAFNRTDQVLAFSILANDCRSVADARAIMDEICKALVDDPLK
jgi:D-alanyl-D-alanine carboxypeptidase/D-alanyl-D-alanine-endopeptidase (penicillin-binding protein 4)